MVSTLVDINTIMVAPRNPNRKLSLTPSNTSYGVASFHSLIILVGKFGFFCFILVNITNIIDNKNRAPMVPFAGVCARLYPLFSASLYPAHHACNVLLATLYSGGGLKSHPAMAASHPCLYTPVNHGLCLISCGVGIIPLFCCRNLNDFII